jgi:hypothetical protein
MRHASIVAVALMLMVAAAQAQTAKRSGMRFWNLTLYTLTSLQFSPPGQNAWGKNQCENDDDKTVDHNERLRITGLTAGRYDARLSTGSDAPASSRTSDVKDGVFSIEEKQLTDCQQK